MTNKAIALEKHGPAGAATRQGLAETPTKFRVKILAVGGATLPRRRHVAYGQIVSVPRHALQDIPAK